MLEVAYTFDLPFTIHLLIWVFDLEVLLAWIQFKGTFGLNTINLKYFLR